MCKIITVACQKGGVGKITTNLNLGYALSQMNKKVLMLDLDPQASLTVCFGVDNHEKLNATIYHLINSILDDELLPPKETYIVKKNDNLHLIPCNIGLFAIEDKLRTETGSERAVSYILDELKSDYDFILIDTPPSLGLLTVNALAASNSVIITVSPQALSAIGISHLLKTVEKIKKRISPTLSVEGILMTMCDNRTNLYKTICEVIEISYGKTINIFNSQIPVSVKIGEANLNKKSIIEYDPKNKTSLAYRDFARDVLSNGK